MALVALADLAQLSRAVVAAGWELGHLTENALVVEGTTFDVTRLQARRPALRAQVTLLRDCPDTIAALERVPAAPPFASRTLGTTQLRVEVIDEARALEELTRLLALASPTETFAGVLATLATQGWRIDCSREDDYDFTWTLHGTRAGEDLSLAVLFGGLRAEEDLHVDGFGAACVVRASARWSLTIRSFARASQLAEALLADH